jgi:transcriptional regulator with GAF, ATPase, and Fis domain
MFLGVFVLWGAGAYLWFESGAKSYVSPILAQTQAKLSENGSETFAENKIAKAVLLADLEKSGKINALYIFNSKNIALLAVSVFAALFLLALGVVIYLYVRFIIPMSDFRQIVKDLSEERNSAVKLRWARGVWEDTERDLKQIVSKITDANESVKMLFSVSKNISSQIDINQILNSVTEMLVNKFSGAMCAVFLPGEGGMLRVAAKRGYSPSFTKSVKIKKGNPIVDSYIYAKTTVVRNLASLDEEFYDYFINEGAVAQVNAPLTNERGDAIGVLSVSSKNGDIFRQDIGDIILLAQKYSSVALRNALVYAKMAEENSKVKSEMSAMSSEIIKTNAKLVQKVKNLKSLFAISHLANSSSDFKQVCGFTIQKIREALGFEVSAVLIEKGERGTFYLSPHSFGLDEERLSSVSFDLKNSKVISKIIEKDSPLIFNEAEEIKKNMQEFYQLYAISSAVFLPIKRACNLNAALVCVNKFADKIDPEDISVLEHVAVIIGGMLDKIKLYEEYADKIEDLTMFQRLFMLIPFVNSNTIFAEIINIAKDIFAADFCSILIYDEEQKALISQPGAYFVEQEEEKIIKVSGEDSDSITAKTFLKNAVYVAEKELETNPYALAIKIKSAIIAPLAYNGNTFGVLMAASKKANVYSQKNKDKMSVFANRAAFIIKLNGDILKNKR